MPVTRLSAVTLGLSMLVGVPLVMAQAQQESIADLKKAGIEL